jgi:hypothetical protein
LYAYHQVRGERSALFAKLLGTVVLAAELATGGGCVSLVEVDGERRAAGRT